MWSWLISNSEVSEANILLTSACVNSQPVEKDVAACLSSDGAKAGSLQGLIRDGPAVESATFSRDITNTGCETPAARRRRRSFGCTSCGKELFSVRKVQEHPDLGVGMCRACYNFLFSSPFTKVQGIFIKLSLISISGFGKALNDCMKLNS